MMHPRQTQAEEESEPSRSVRVMFSRARSMTELTTAHRATAGIGLAAAQAPKLATPLLGAAGAIAIGAIATIVAVSVAG